METSHRPYTHSLAHRGVIQGLTITSPKNDKTELCHFFGGVRYALPPTQRWHRARPLPATFSYGSKDAPAICNMGAGLCPQPGFRDLSPLNPLLWSEDCFQCNIWVPVGQAPRGGWPVFIYIRTSPPSCLQYSINIGNRP